jgi:hypothetical protein
MSKPIEGTGHTQGAAGGNCGLAPLLSWPRHHLVAFSFMYAHAGGTREGIPIFCLSFSLPPTNTHAFKIGTLVFQIITLAKRQKDSPLLGFCYEFNKTFGFFYDYKCSFSEIISRWTKSVYLFHAY